MVKCSRCSTRGAALRRPKTGERICRECFYAAFEQEVHETIVSTHMFRRGQRVAIAASGGKDSTVLAHVLTTLNERMDYGLDLFLLSIDEGIRGYRDDSLATVQRNEERYEVPLLVVSYADLYGWTMDQIAERAGTRGNCTYCGVLRRQALDRGARLARADAVATGHNADDIAETVLLNFLRGDAPRLSRCASAVTGRGASLPRAKPLRRCYEKEIVLYAHFQGLDYFSTECVYAPRAARGLAREFVKDLEALRPRAIDDLVTAAEQMAETSDLWRVLQGEADLDAGKQTEEPAEGALPRPATKTREEEMLNDLERAKARVGKGEGISEELAAAPSDGRAPAKAADSDAGQRNPEVGPQGPRTPERVATETTAPSSASGDAPVRLVRERGPGTCRRCGYLTSQEVCKACLLLEGLERGLPRLGIGRARPTLLDKGDAADQRPAGPTNRLVVPDARSTIGPLGASVEWTAATTI